jgi:hypothetical protein
MAECNQQCLLFKPHGTREVVAAFDGGRLTSDAGAVLLRGVEARLGIMHSCVPAFTDHRDPERIEFCREPDQSAAVAVVRGAVEL